MTAAFPSLRTLPWSAFRGILVGVSALLFACSPATTADPAPGADPVGRRTFTDAAGRTVEVPGPVERVFAAGPPASVLLYTMAPDRMVGWVRAPSEAQKGLLAAPWRDLPETGRLTGKGSTANLEAVLAAHPDLIVDVGYIDDTYRSLADRVQGQTGVPYILLDGAFVRTPETYRSLGALLGVSERAEALATWAEEALREPARRVAAIPVDRRPGVYYARGPAGLETSLAGSITLEALDVLGVRNVAAAAGEGGLTDVSLEQVLAWNPDVILATDEGFATQVHTDPRWAPVRAVQDRRVVLPPAVPWGWVDSPPGVNRLLGMWWLGEVLWPDLFPEDLAVTTRAFYRLFYQVDLTDAQVAALLPEAR